MYSSSRSRFLCFASSWKLSMSFNRHAFSWGMEWYKRFRSTCFAIRVCLKKWRDSYSDLILSKRDPAHVLQRNPQNVSQSFWFNINIEDLSKVVLSGLLVLALKKILKKMHWVALHLTGRVFDRFGGGETDGEVCSILAWMSALRRRKSLFFCFLQSAINALLAAGRRWHSSSVDDVAKIKSASMAWTFSAKTYSAAWRFYCSTTGNPFSWCWMSSINCSFLNLFLTFVNRAFSCRRLRLRWSW